MIFKVTIEKDGVFSCIVNADTVKGNVSFPFEFNSNVWVDVVRKLKVKSSDLYIYIYTYINGQTHQAIYQMANTFQNWWIQAF